MASQTFEKGKVENLNANKCTRTGWTFAGWAANKNGKVLGCTTLKSCELSEAQYNDSAKIKSYAIYKDKQSVKDIASPGETVKLVAIWAKMASAEKTNCTKQSDNSILVNSNGLVEFEIVNSIRSNEEDDIKYSIF